MNNNPGSDASNEQTALERAGLLYSASRFDLAAKELRAYLTRVPDDFRAHSLLALCLCRIESSSPNSGDGRDSESVQAALSAVRLGPDQDFAYFALACAWQAHVQSEKAELAIKEAIRLDPTCPLYSGFLARCHQDALRWPEALNCAERGLAYDPEHVQCSNTRTLALWGLQRFDEARAAARYALSANPLDAAAHANMGFIELQSGYSRRALMHYGTSLRIDPTLTWVIHQCADAVRTRNLFSGSLLTKLDIAADVPDWVLGLTAVGSWFFVRILSRVAKEFPSCAMWIATIIVAFFFFDILIRVFGPVISKFALSLDEQQKVKSRRYRHRWTSIEIAYCLSLACLPLPMFWWPGVLLSIAADVFLIVTVVRGIDHRVDALSHFELILIFAATVADLLVRF